MENGRCFWPLNRPFDYGAQRARFDRLRDEVVSVLSLTAESEEEVAFPHLP